MAALPQGTRGKAYHVLICHGREVGSRSTSNVSKVRNYVIKVRMRF